MEETTIEDYLTYIPCEVAKAERFSSSTKTTMPNHPRDLEGVEICCWTSFPEIVRKTRGSLSSEKKLPSLPCRKAGPCGNEAQLELQFHQNLFIPLIDFMGYLGVEGYFVTKPSEVILDPDCSWSSIGEPPSRILEPKILVEVKTFWAFDPPDDLVAILDPVRTQTKKQKSCAAEMVDKVRRGVSQIYGYMTVNNIRYSVLATYKKFFFLRREEGTPLNSRLEITFVIRREQMRESQGFTLMEAWLSLILTAEADHVFASPNKSPILETKKHIVKEPMELSSESRLGALWFGKRRTRSQLGAVVDGGLRGLKETESVMKIVDKSKSMNMPKKLEHEVCVYKQMTALQGNIVPEVRGFLLVYNWMMVLVLSHCGGTISHRQFLDHYKDIKKMVEQIHEAGVAHRDLKCANILIDANDKVTIVDFSEAILQSDAGDTKFLRDCEGDLDDLTRLKGSLESEIEE